MFESIIIRPVSLNDLSRLVELLDTLTDSLTTMPRDESVLEKRIHKSIQSFYDGVSEAGSEQYLFVMEDLETRKVVGTASIIARVGGYEPFYTYEIQQEEFGHEPLGIKKTIDVLHLKSNHNGPSEIGSLFIHPDYRKGGLGRLLSLTRFIFARVFRSRFRTKVIAELRGYINEEGKSPFWETVGRHFFDQEFDQADFLSGIGNKEFIRDLMPRHPIYLPLLPYETHGVIGKVHQNTIPAKAILMKEGFNETNVIDIFDAGPMLEAKFEDLHCFKNTTSTSVTGISDQTDDGSFIISNGSLNFQSCLGKITHDSQGCQISKRVADLLNVGVGDVITFTSVL